MVWSFFYLVVRRVLQLAALRFRSAEFKELEIVVLRHELAVLRRRVSRPELTPTDRVFLAAASRLLPRTSWGSFVVTPTTLLSPLAMNVGWVTASNWPSLRCDDGSVSVDRMVAEGEIIEATAQS